MDLEDVENGYKQEIEAAEKEFLNKIKNKENIIESERNYKHKLKLSRERYYKAVSEILKKQKNYVKEKTKPKGKNEKARIFKVKTENFELNFFQKLKFKFRLLNFKIWFKTRNFLRKKTPESVFYNYVKIKLKIKRIVTKLKALIIKSIEQTKNYLQRLFEILKEKVKNIYKKIMELPEKIINKLSKKKENAKDRIQVEKKEEKDKSQFKSK